LAGACGVQDSALLPQLGDDARISRSASCTRSTNARLPLGSRTWRAFALGECFLALREPAAARGALGQLLRARAPLGFATASFALALLGPSAHARAITSGLMPTRSAGKRMAFTGDARE
jgi:hypothetical protein